MTSTSNLGEPRLATDTEVQAETVVNDHKPLDQVDGQEVQAPVPTLEPTSQPATAATTEPVTAQTHVQPLASTSESTIKVWKPVAAGTAPRIPDLPDSYYTPSANELRLAHSGQTQKLKALGVDTNFTTKKQRDAEAREKELKRISRWPKTVIRVRFPDRHQIEQIFPSSITINKIYDFTKSSMTEEVRNKPFVLYIPPRQELKLIDPKVNNRSLLDLQLAPSSVLMVRFNDASLNDSAKVAPLLPELLARAQELPPPPTFQPEAQQQNAATSSSKEDDAKSQGRTLGSGAKVPKWLKVGNKK